MERNDRIEEELFPFYALDALTDEERAEVESYVAGNPAARARLDEAMSAVAEFVTAAPLTPDPSAKARLMARIEDEAVPQSPATPSSQPSPIGRGSATPSPQPSPTGRGSTRPSATGRGSASRGFSLRDFFFGRAMGFAVLLLLLGGFGLWRLAQQSSALRAQVTELQSTTAALQATLEATQGENQVLRRELAARDETLAQLRQPGAITIAIGDATGEHPAAVGTLTMNPTTGQAALDVANLPPLHEGTTYQAWMIVGGVPVSAGTFAVDAAGQGHHVMPQATLGTFEAIGVSLEPSGGSEQPTPGKIVLLGGVTS